MASSRFGIPAPVTAGRGYCCNDVFIALDYGEWKENKHFRTKFGPDGLGLVGDAKKGAFNGGTASNYSDDPIGEGELSPAYYDAWGPFQTQWRYWDDTGAKKHPDGTGRPVTRGGTSQVNSPTYGQVGRVGPDWITMPLPLFGVSQRTTMNIPPGVGSSLVPVALRGNYVSQMVERFQKCKGTDADMERVVRIHNGGPRPGPPFSPGNTDYWNRAYNGLRREGRTLGAINGSNNPNDGPGGVGRPVPSTW